MFRKTILASSLSLALASHGAWGLGLGSMRPESALNQPFSGEIELVGVNPDELDAVKVSLAPEAEFTKRGVNRQHYLTKLRFKPQVSAQGKAVIRVTTVEPIREPYMDFLVEVKWPEGRMVKGFTVLLDPPVTSRGVTPSVTPAVASTRVAAQPRPAVRPDPGSASRPVAAPARSKAAPVSPRADVQGFPLSSGPIGEGAGLWRTARSMSPPGATVAQTAMALYRNNQNAFVRGNINILRKGVVLQIPSSAELFALDADVAEREFQAALNGRKVTAKPLTDVTAAVPDQGSRLKIAGTTAPVTAEREAPAPAADGSASAAAPAVTPELEQELLLLRETSESTQLGTEELRARVRQLETHLTDIQTLLTLRDAELARLQQAAAGGEGRTVPEPETGPAVAGAPVELAPTPTGHPTDLGPTAAEPVKTTGAAGSAEAPEPVAAGGADESWLGQLPLVGDTLDALPTPVLWSLGLAGPLIGVLGWVSVRRRRRAEDHLGAFDLPGSLGTQGEDTPSVSPGIASADAFRQPEPDQPDASEDAALEDPDLWVPEEDSDESEVLSEADIYIAYGRYPDAEVLLKRVIDQSPARADLRYKLAEVYVGAKNPEALAALMAEMDAAGMDRESPKEWSRLVAEAKGLRAGATGGAAVVAAGAAGAAGLAGSAAATPFGQDWSANQSDKGGVGGVASAQSRDSDAGLHTPGPVLGRKDTPSGDADDLMSEDLRTSEFDFDLDELGSETETSYDDIPADQTDEVDAITGSSHAGSSEFDLTMADLTMYTDTELTELGFSEALQKVSASPQPKSDWPNGGIDTSESLLSPMPRTGVPGDEPFAQWQAEEGGWDEVATKLDLGRAYVEMSDHSAAQAILHEVMEEGTPEQQAEAKKLLSLVRGN